MKILTFILLLFVSRFCFAQTGPENLFNNQISLYAQSHHSPTLFVHFDKNVYTNNENVWLTGYLFGADYSKYNVLSVALVKDEDKSVWMEDRFIIKNGLSVGNAIVPDTVGPGNYTFIVTTDRLKNGSPDVLFTQPVTIKTVDAQTYTASLNPLDTSVNAAQQKVMLLVNFPHVKEIPSSVPVSYYVGNSDKPVLQGKAETKSGQYIFTVPSDVLVQGRNLLHVQVKYKNEVKDMSIPLPAKEKLPSVAFYPEGGNMVEGIFGTVGFEIKNGAGDAMGTTAFLYENSKIIDSLQSNHDGMGKFSFVPLANNNYSIKLYHNKTDTSYQLPKAITQGPALSLTNAVVNDTLTVTIRDNQQERLYLTGHNYKQLFFTQPVDMTATVKRIKLIIKDIPKGLTQLTLTDSIGRLFAERTFFAHYNKREPISIATGKPEYKTREKVNVKIRLNTAIPDSGYVSVACVQENRISINKKQDIESYFYLKNDLGELPIRETYLSNTEADKQFLENILLIKGWSRYKWTDVLKARPEDTVAKYDKIVFKGTVVGSRTVPRGGGVLMNQESALMNQESALKKSVTVINLNDPIHPIITGNSGNFILQNTGLVTKLNKTVNLRVDKDDPADYRIKVPDPFLAFSQTLAGQLAPGAYNISGQAGTEYMQVPDNEHAVLLKEVKIKDNSDDSFYGSLNGQKATRNPCGDFENSGWFNCYQCGDHEHADHPAVKGVVYYDPVTGQGTVYEGCDIGEAQHTLQLKGIYAAQEFYPLDYVKTPDPPNSYLSTLYWKHLLRVSSLKDTELSFYTGDITGRYKIVVQGVTGNDVTYGEAVFNIVKAK